MSTKSLTFLPPGKRPCWEFCRKVYMRIVDLKEILDGERKDKPMEKEMKETVLRAVDYTNAEAERYNKRVRICNGIAMLLVLAYTIIKGTSLYDNPTVMAGLDIVQGFAVGMLFWVCYIQAAMVRGLELSKND